ncbi:MAG: biotin synthase [Burkholderiaceae bacterium]|nr:biotin synthase [Burkholderiaceae bacterium]
MSTAPAPERHPPALDPVAALRWARQALTPAQSSPWLHEEVGRRMEARLQWMTRQPRHWIDWAPLRGGLQTHALLTQRYRAPQCYVIEPEPALQEATAHALNTPWWRTRRWRAQTPRFGTHALPEGGVDLLWSNMALHMAPDPQDLITRWYRHVATEGFLMFSCLGPNTLHELRAIYATQDWSAPCHEFTDMHDWGDQLVAAGFAEPVMDMEHIELTWSTPAAALAELRTLGRNLHPARFGALRGRRWHTLLVKALADAAAQRTDGRVALSFEIVYGHAFKPVPRAQLASETQVPLRDMREILQRRL